jgi:hypothetical protein
MGSGLIPYCMVQVGSDGFFWTHRIIMRACYDFPDVVARERND